MPTEPPDVYETFPSLREVGQFLKRQRRQRGLSQPWVATRMNVDPSAVSRLESGKLKRNAMKLLAAYAAALHMTLEVNYALYQKRSP